MNILYAYLVLALSLPCLARDPVTSCPSLVAEVVRRKTGVEVIRDGKTVYYSATGRSLDRLFFDWPLSWTQNLEGANILDIGCGTGELASDLEKAGALYTGIDICLAPGLETDSRFYERDAIQTLLPSDEFDYVYANYTFYTFDNNVLLFEAALRESARVTRSGGRIRLGPVHLVELLLMAAAKIPEIKLLRSRSSIWLEFEVKKSQH